MKGLTTLLWAIAVCATGCGDLGTGEPTGRVQEVRVLKPQDIERYPGSSPARAFLEWWRALQFDNPVAARRHYASAGRPSEKKLAHQLTLGPDLLNLAAVVDISDVTRTGDKATVFVVFTKLMRHPNGRHDTARLARSFNLLRENGEWKLADNRYMDRIARLAKLYIDRARRQELRSGQAPGR